MRLWPGKRNNGRSEDISRVGDSVWSAPGQDDAVAGTRPLAWSCAYCHRARPPYVYSAGGKAYCVPCSHAIEEMGMPVGEQRPDDAAELPSQGDQ